MNDFTSIAEFVNVIRKEVLYLGGIMRLLAAGIIFLSSIMLNAPIKAGDIVPPSSKDAKPLKHSAEIEGMSLNKGEKWGMDDHTRKSFDEMAKSFLNIEIESLSNDDLKARGVTLQNGLDKLIRGCTMDGAPHDQLHVFLMEYMPEVAALSQTGNIEHAQKIQHYLESYSTYFK